MQWLRTQLSKILFLNRCFHLACILRSVYICFLLLRTVFTTVTQNCPLYYRAIEMDNQLHNLQLQSTEHCESQHDIKVSSGNMTVFMFSNHLLPSENYNLQGLNKSPIHKIMQYPFLFSVTLHYIQPPKTNGLRQFNITRTRILQRND